MGQSKFIWKTKLGSKHDHKPSVRKAKFGDGYSARAPDGINHDMRKISIECVGTHAEISLIDDFLKEHKGCISFFFTPTDTNIEAKFICPSWSRKRINKHSDKSMISTTFEEVPA